jgi:hypothetical protein
MPGRAAHVDGLNTRTTLEINIWEKHCGENQTSEELMEIIQDFVADEAIARLRNRQRCRGDTPWQRLKISSVIAQVEQDAAD